MKTGAIIAIVAIILVVLVVAFWIIFGGFSTTQSDTEVNTETGSNSENTQTGEVSEETGNQETSGVGSSNTQEFTVEINNSGFFPKDLEINQGDAVAWINMGSSSSWPASAMHPTHTVYPGSNINKCGTAEEGSIFDACKGLKNGESYVFTFNEVGSWGYHDHLNPTHFGKITVK